MTSATEQTANNKNSRLRKGEPRDSKHEGLKIRRWTGRYIPEVVRRAFGKSVSGTLVRSKKCLDRDVWGARILNLWQRGRIIWVLRVQEKGHMDEQRTQRSHERHVHRLPLELWVSQASPMMRESRHLTAPAWLCRMSAMHHRLRVGQTARY